MQASIGEFSLKKERKKKRISFQWKPNLRLPFKPESPRQVKVCTVDTILHKKKDMHNIYMWQTTHLLGANYFGYCLLLFLLFCYYSSVIYLIYTYKKYIYYIYYICYIYIYIYVYIILLLYMLLFFYIWSSRSVYFDLVFLGIWYSYYASHNIFASRCNIAWHVNTWEKSKFESFLYFWFYGNLLGFHDLLNLIFMKCLHP